MNIPIQNIYYLLCYAWDKLEERDTVAVQPIEANQVIDLLARVLISGMAHLFKRGLDRGYIEFEEETKRIRGKINISETIKKNLLLKNQVYCHFDEMNHDILHNQIIKTTIGQLIHVDELDKKLKQELILVYRKLQDISEIKLTPKSFTDVRLNQSNFFYDFLLKICELVIDNLLISEDEGESKFRDFLQDKYVMPYLFESFVRNFYRKEQDSFVVKRETIPWLAIPLDDVSAEFLPKMQTDVSLISEGRHIVIDTKFYQEAFQQHYGKQTIRSGHLYQLSGYLSNLAGTDEKGVGFEGVLLYPTVNEEIHLAYELQGNKVTVSTIDLNQEWQQIHQNLLNLLY